MARLKNVLAPKRIKKQRRKHGNADKELLTPPDLKSESSKTLQTMYSILH